jgi:hypothetical protein
VSRDIKQAVMRCRKNIRRSGVYVNEDLCRDQQALFNRIRNHDDAYQVWSWNGIIFFKDYNDRIHKIQYGEVVSHVMDQTYAKERAAKAVGSGTIQHR